jgi:hypothetical protein
LCVDPLGVYLLTGGEQEFHYKCFHTGIPYLCFIGPYSNQEQINKKNGYKGEVYDVLTSVARKRRAWPICEATDKLYYF